MLRQLNAFARQFMCLTIVIFALGTTAEAQGRFDPILRVGDTLITRFELDERTRLLALLNAPGDPRQLAQQQLTDAAIQTDAAERAGIVIDEEELQAGLSEFAGRAELTADEFIAALAQNGVGADTFIDFVAAGIAWRNYVRARFGDEARDLPQSLILRTLTRTGTDGGRRVLLTEIILPATTPETRAASLARANELSSLTDEADFRAAARSFSIAPSRGVGGEVNWRAFTTLPEPVQPAVSNLAIGDVSRPVDLGTSIGLFYLRDSETIAAGTPDTLNVDYLTYQTAGGPAEAERVRNTVDTCDDFYGLINGIEDPRLVRQSVPNAGLPQDIRAAIQSLDTNETTLLTRDGATRIVMLCGRTIEAESSIDFELVGTRLLNTKLTALASHHLAELRAATVVEELSN